jgi:hypothetical protein
MSVVVNHISGSRHGNQLCQYVIGRIISEKLKFKLFGIDQNHREFALNGFDLNYNQPDYAAYNTPIQKIGTSSTYHYSETLEWAHPDFDLDAICNDTTPRKILLEGFFQRKKYFLPFKEQIKEWYNFINYDIPSNHAAIHIRLGDLRESNHPDLLPIEYYQQALDMLDFNKLTICTDTPTDSEYILPLIKKYNAEIFTGDERETICFLASHNNLVLSVGSFSFWASLFSEGKNIINAIPTKGNNRIDSENGVDLLLQSERHKYIDLR